MLALLARTYIIITSEQGAKHMEYRVKMTDNQTGKSGMVFSKVSGAEQANRIVAHMNKLNEESARLTGKAIRFVFSVMVKY